MTDEYAYNGRLNNLRWSGCKNLWSHGGAGLDRQKPPGGFRTVGVPGVLLALHCQGAPGIPAARMDDLVRGSVDEQGERYEYSPIFIIGHNRTPDGRNTYEVVFEGERMHIFDHKDFGWVAFTRLDDLVAWLKDN